MTSARIPRQISSFRLERLDDDLLLYHPGLTKTVHLNETASLIWQLCDGVRSVEDIATLLQESFPNEAAQIAADIETTLSRLADEGAIEFA
jgi:hypothetical protein